MERPWLLLCRVLRVDAPGDNDDDLHVDAEDHGLDVAAGGGHQNAGVAAEAEEGAQEHGAGGEGQGEEDEDADVAAEDDAAPNVEQLLEESVIFVNTQVQVSEMAHAQMRLWGESDFTITVAPPPSVSSLITGPGAHPDPQRPDIFPYVVATGRFCLLVHFAIAPSYGTNFGQAPNHSHLVVVRHFLREEDGVQIAACALPVPDRPNHDDDDDDDDESVPALSNIDSVGFVCNLVTGHIQIAELIVTTGAPQVAVIYYGTVFNRWHENPFDNPLLTVDHHRDWVSHGTVTINSTVVWYDLSWGMISCNLAQPPLQQVLNFHRLPPGRVLRAGAGAGVPADLRCRRCIAVSESLVRYVEIILSPGHDKAATVNMWYRDVEGNPPWRWQTNYSVSLEEIWGHHSYQQTALPRTTPNLVGVSPVDSNVIYFSLNQRLFGVNMPEHTVVDCELYQPLRRPGPDDEPDTSRYFISWNLGFHLAINVGHQPDDPSDHGDSSPGGPADEGDIDYQTPPE